MKNKYAIIIGAGPAGLTAAYELLKHTDIIPLVYEKSGDIGGISKTINYKGNRIDIGGHRFFSKSDRVMDWWAEIMPIEQNPNAPGKLESTIHYQGKERTIATSKPSINGSGNDLVMLIRNRISRIFYNRKLFDYPLALNFNTFGNLGLVRLFKISFSYVLSSIRPIKPENTLEDFFINRFGRELYLTFFKDYTEKVWGVSCDKIDASWGAQRIKGLSITKALLHALKSLFGRTSDSINQSSTETSLIERFLYPKYGPGQMWEEVARQVIQMGGQVMLSHEATTIKVQDNRVMAVTFNSKDSDDKITVEADYVFSTMPMSQLINSFDKHVPQDILAIANGLEYRDFLTVGLLLKKLTINDTTEGQKDGSSTTLPDNWIYIQESDVKVGRIQIFNNWSQYMVKDPDTIWIGLEYFCNEGDELWSMDDKKLMDFAIQEIQKIGFANSQDVLDSTVIRMPKAYPGYFGDAYKEIETLRRFTDDMENLYLIGRNGMHKYNNQDHSMLSAMIAVENIHNGITSKQNIWNINAEDCYHEIKNN
ncbi:MAG: NAD(P)/FAD-dependent oxidoreductase [Candidatus Thiodiazotropha endolucinida]